MSDWELPKRAKKRNRGYKPPNWVEHIGLIVQQMAQSDFFHQQTRAIERVSGTEPIMNIVSLGIG